MGFAGNVENVEAQQLNGLRSGDAVHREVRTQTPYRDLLLEQMAMSAGDVRRKKYHDGSSISLLNLNYPPETDLLGTVYSELLASPATPATMEKDMRTQDCPPPEIFDFSDEVAVYNMVQNGFGTSQQATTDDPFQPCFSEAGLAYGTAFLQHQEHGINVVSQSKEIPLQHSEEGNHHGIDLSKTPRRKPKPKPRRKKHRPKVIREDKPVRTPKPATPKPGTPRRARKTEDTSQVKKKYVRKKKDSNPPEKFSNALGETVDGLHGGSVRRPARRRLNFDLDSQERERRSTSDMLSTRNAESQAAVFSFDTKLDVHSVQGRDTEVLENPLGERFMFDDSSPKESRSEGLPEPLKGFNFVSKINDLNKVPEPSIGEGEILAEHTRKSNCLNVVGDLETSLEADEVQVASDNTTDGLLKGTKRGHDLVYDAQVSTEINLMHAHSETDRVGNNHDVSGTDDCFLQIHKKKRTNNAENLDAKSFMGNENLLAPESMLVFEQAETTTGCRRVPAQCPLSLDAVVEQPKVSTPVKLSNQSNMGHSQPSACEKFTDDQDYICCGSQARMEALTKSKKLKSKTQGRRKKEIPHNELMDDIILKLWYLNINGEYQNFTAVQQNALVLYARGPGPVVTFGGSLNKKRRPRAKVDLDPESDRVWKLLMGKETGDGEPGVDNEKWWEEERRVFHGRVDSFISRMHSIQGDRRFSRWKGSVLDSVIGVFLTQNVTDHLSSSAYMSLAARFPVKSRGGSESQKAEKVSSSIASEDAIGEDGKLSGQGSGAPSYVVVHESEQVDVVVHESEQVDLKEMANRKESIESNTQSRVFDYGKGNGFLCHERELHIGHVSPEIGSTTAVNIMSCTNGVEGENRRSLEDFLSSPNTVVSSQNSSEYPGQEADQGKRNTLCSIDGDDLISRGIGNPSTNSFMELWKLASKLQEMNSLHKGSVPMEYNGGINQLTNSSIDQRPSFPNHFGYLDNRQSEISTEHLTTGRAALSATFQQGGTEPTLQVETRNQPNIFQKTASGVPNTELKAKKVKAETKKVKAETEEKSTRHWDSLRKQAFCNGAKKERSSSTMDSMDYEALRNADVNEISHTIIERGMNNMLAARMKGLLNRLVEDHGSTDMEWLRDVPPDQVKDYLLSIRGLGLKSTECVRLLTLHHLAFPVDTNVGRIAVRLGWVPLQNLPDYLQLHLLEQYPIMEHIQKYLWPRLCKLDQQTLYELHYQMITFGKVFCTKSKPNCNACPMKGECKHFASAFANSRLLTGPEDKSPASSATPVALEGGSTPVFRTIPLPQIEECTQSTPVFRTMPLPQIEECTQSHDQTPPRNCEPIIEEPASPEPEYEQTLESAIEDDFYNDPDEIPAINLNMEEFTYNLKSYMQQNMDLQDGDISNALVAVTSESANIPMPKLKNPSRLRTEHQVYELPDSHPLLEGMDDREPDDPSPYLLSIWNPGETAHSSEPPKVSCDLQDTTKLCEDNTCFSCNTKREVQAKTVRGTLLIPCRTAMRGSFPLNGTYFQVNEVFADHYSSRYPINVPRNWIWNLPRRTVYFGSSIQTIFKGLTTKEIQHCFWRGFVCVRGFERATRQPKPLYARLHLSATKATQEKMAAKAANVSSNAQAATGNKS